MKARIKRITMPNDKRVICISDIHGNLDLFKLLLNKIKYTEKDILILLGDLYTKGMQGHDTIKFIMAMSQNPNVYVIRGNCDWVEDYLEDSEKEWLGNLPHIIEAQDYIFVHGGLVSNNLDENDAKACMKNDAFMEQGLTFGKYVVTGHWPTVNYTHKIPCFNPIVSETNKIISIDGGSMLKVMGQLNAFIISDGKFSFEFVDDLPVMRIVKSQAASGGELNITWEDRFIELVDEGDEFGVYRHIKSNRLLELPNSAVWSDKENRLCLCDYGTDYYLPVNAGDTVSVIKRFGGRLYAKLNGIAGWIEL